MSLGASFYRSRIRSDARLDYDQLDLVFSGRAAAPEGVSEPLALAREAAARLGEQRGDRGLEVESAEPEFSSTARGMWSAAGRCRRRSPIA